MLRRSANSRWVSPWAIRMAMRRRPIAQVHAALAYYHANREDIEADLAAETAEADRLQPAGLASAAAP